MSGGGPQKGKKNRANIIFQVLKASRVLAGYCREKIFWEECVFTQGSRFVFKWFIVRCGRKAAML